MNESNVTRRGITSIRKLIKGDTRIFTFHLLEYKERVVMTHSFSHRMMRKSLSGTHMQGNCCTLPNPRAMRVDRNDFIIKGGQICVIVIQIHSSEEFIRTKQLSGITVFKTNFAFINKIKKSNFNPIPRGAIRIWSIRISDG